MKLKKALKIFDNKLELYIYGNNIKIPLFVGNKIYIQDCAREYLKCKVLAMRFNVRGLNMNIYIKENITNRDKLKLSTPYGEMRGKNNETS